MTSGAPITDDASSAAASCSLDVSGAGSSGSIGAQFALVNCVEDEREDAQHDLDRDHHERQLERVERALAAVDQGEDDDHDEQQHAQRRRTTSRGSGRGSAQPGAGVLDAVRVGAVEDPLDESPDRDRQREHQRRQDDGDREQQAGGRPARDDLRDRRRTTPGMRMLLPASAGVLSLMPPRLVRDVQQVHRRAVRPRRNHRRLGARHHGDARQDFRAPRAPRALAGRAARLRRAADPGLVPRPRRLRSRRVAPRARHLPAALPRVRRLRRDRLPRDRGRAAPHPRGRARRCRSRRRSPSCPRPSCSSTTTSRSTSTS